MLGCLEVFITLLDLIVRPLGVIILVLLPCAILFAFTGGSVFEPFPNQGLPPHGDTVTVGEYWCCTAAFLPVALVAGITAIKKR